MRRIEESRKDAHADPAVDALGCADELQDEVELLGVGDVVGSDVGDALEGDLMNVTFSPNARRARIAIFAAASPPPTSAVGSASA